MKPSFDQVVKSYIRLVYYFALRHGAAKEDVDDIVSDTMLKAFNAYDTFTFNSDNQLKSWLLTICHNVIRDRFKMHTPTFVDIETLDTIKADSSVEAIEDKLIQDNQVEQVNQVMTTLDPIDQEIIKLRVVETMSFKEISGIYQVAEAAAKMRYYRAMNQLRANL